MPILPNNDLDYVDEETEDITSEDMTDGSSVTENSATYSDPFDYTGPADIGVPSALPVDPVVPESDEDHYYVTYYNRGDLTEYEPAYLKELSDAGCKFYAIYDDETEVEIPWTDIEDLDPLETEIDLSEAIAAASNQHFWDDTNGVHVSEVAKEDWQAALQANFADLSASKNYYNILMNSLGLLLRRANFNLTSINRAAISFYDGLGNETTNIMASFGRNSAQIGRPNDKHVIIDDSGLTAYNADGTLAPLTGTFDGANINNSSITNSKIVDGTIEGTKIASATIDNSNIKNGTIEGTKIKGGTITGSLIADGTIENTDIKNGTITGTKIAEATIDNSNIKNGTIEGTKIASATIDDSNIKNGTITGTKIAEATIDNSNIKNGTITGTKIASATIDNSNIKNGTIEGTKIKSSTITSSLIADGTIEDTDIKNGTITGTKIAAATIEDSNIKAGTITGAKIAESTIENSNIKDGTITGTKIQGATLTDIPYAGITDADIEVARVANAEIDKAKVDYAHITNGVIDNANIDKANVNGLAATYATIVNLNAANAKISDLESTRVRTTDLEANYITADAIEAAYTKTDFSNTDVAWIQNGVIKDGSISSAMINSVSANKLTAGTINGSVINVTNLNANNITAGTINGQRIGEGSLSLDKLSEDVYTEAEVDAKLSTMQSQIDGAIETWTGTAVPTLQNAPASSWNTTALKDSHVGDVYFVVNSNSQQNGYNYRFTKSGSTYSWQLIKDSDVTNALQRLNTAEGKITTFDSDISQLKTDTGTLTTKTTSLETRMSDAESDILDKVDTTTFNEVSDTVDSHSQSISQMSTTLSNKADSSTVSAVTQRVSKNEQDISGINTTIGTLQTTVASKADGSTVETMSTKLNTVSDTVDGHTQSLQSITQTQTSIQQNAVKSTVQLWFTKANTTAPDKPTAHVTTNNAATGNAWNLAVPTYNASYPNYYYCYEYQYLDGSYGWSAVTRDIATGEMQATARQAQSDIDNLEIGGRNLLKGTGSYALWDPMYSAWSSHFISTDEWIKFTPGENKVWLTVEPHDAFIPIEDWDIDSKYTLSVDIKYDNRKTSTTYPRISVDTATNKNVGHGSKVKEWAIASNPSTNDWTHFENTFDGDYSKWQSPGSGTAAYVKVLVWLYIDSSEADAVYIRRLKLEKGNRATDWTPAPEDVDADISTAQTSADNAQATANKNIKESQQLWFTKANGSAPNKPTAKVTSTSTGGNAWTTKVPTYNASYPHYFYCMQYIAADGTVTWSDVVYDQATTEAQSVARMTSANLTTLQQDYATFKQTTQQFESTIGTTYATKTELQTTDDKIENLEIGGRNLVTKSQLNPSNWTHSYPSSTRFEGDGYENIWTMVTTSSWEQCYLEVPVEIGASYVLSLEYKVDKAYTIYPGDSRGVCFQVLSTLPPNSAAKNVELCYIEFPNDVSSYERKTASFTPSTSSVFFNINGGFMADGAASANTSIHVNYIKLEKGTKATDWTPAPEDVDAAIEAVPRMAKINTFSHNFTSSHWNTFGAVGHVENWTTGATYDNSHLRVGDRAYLVGTISDKNAGSATIIGEVTNVQPEGVGTSYVTLKSEQLIFGGDVVAAVESRVTNAETSITQNNNQIALKANASDVYTKTQVDGKITQEVSDRNSAIEQSASAINLSVSQTYTTKTEFNALEIGGRNYLKGSELMSRDDYGWFADSNASISDGVATLNGTASDWNAKLSSSLVDVKLFDDDYVRVSFDYKASIDSLIYIDIDGSNVAPDQKNVNNRTKYKTSSRTLPAVTEWTRYEWSVIPRVMSDITSGSGDVLSIYVGIWNRTDNSVFQIRHLKLEKGTKATDWSPAPEDMATQSSLESAKSEIKATTDGITSTVSKISSAKYLDTSYSYSLANIKTYAADGYSGGWTVSDAKNSKVGDTVYLKVTDTARVCSVYIKGTITAISGTRITMTSHGYEDVLPVDTIKSTINQSSDSVKIQAKHVEIDGAAIFSNTAFKQAADAAYDAKGSAASLVAGGDNLIGGFNFTSSPGAIYSHLTGTFTSTTTTNTVNSTVNLLAYNYSTLVKQIGSGFDTAHVGKVCNWTFEKESTFNRICLKFNGNKADACVNWDISSIANGTELTLSFRLDSISSDGKGNGGVMSGINLRKGNMPSQWSLAPEDEVIGGRNLLRNSSVEHSQSSSASAWFEWQITDAPLETSQDYTISFDAKTSNGTDVFYIGFANGSAVTQENMATGIKPITAYERMSVTARTTKTNIRSIVVSSTKQYGRGNESNSGGTLYIKNVKFEKGNKATDWTPAPEDVDASIASVANNAAPKASAVTRTQRIYWRATSNTKPSANTTWLSTSGDGYGNWSLNVPQLTKGTTKYPYLYTAVQSQTVAQQAAGSACTCSTVMIDDSTTVIDGGKIITNSIDAEKLNVTDINASHTLTIGAMTTETQAAIDNSNVVIGGRNLLKNTNWNSETIKKFKTATSSTNTLGNAIGEWYRETQVTLGFDESGLMTITVPDGNTRYGIYQDVSLSPGHYILSVNTGSFFKSHIGSSQWPGVNTINGNGSRNSVEIDVAEEAIYRVYINHNNGAVIYGNYIKLEKGTKATDWSPAPEDVDADISAAAQTATNYITHVDNNGITIHPSSNTNNRVGINANGMTVYKGGYLKANFADTITLYGGSNASGANPKMEVTSTQIKMTSSDGTQRLSADSTTGVVVGNPSKGRVVVNDSGLTIYDINSRKRTAIDSNGLEVFAGTNSASVASFGTTARIGSYSTSHIRQDYHSLQMVDKEGETYFHVSDLRNEGGYADIDEDFLGDGSTTTFDLSLEAVEADYSVIAGGQEVTSGISKTTTKFIFNTAPANGTVIHVSYDSTSDLAKAYTFGKRIESDFEYPVGVYSIAEGYDLIASGAYSHAEGNTTTASGIMSHAEGYLATASGMYSHAEGTNTTASGAYSHAEGGSTEASGAYSHAEGTHTTASVICSHAEGRLTEASGGYSHAEGMFTVASGSYSHAQNHDTIAASSSQTAIGRFNDNKSTNAFEIGNGTANDARSNALVVGWNGSLIAQGMAGMIQMFAGSTAPTGWLVCDGSTVSRTEYATLFAAIGITWGAGDGSTTFNLPDLRGRAPIGAGAGSGLTARTLGASGGTQDAVVPYHNHSVSAITGAITGGAHTHPLTYNSDAGSGTARARVVPNGSGDTTSNGGAKSNTHTHDLPAHNTNYAGTSGNATGANMQPFAVVNFIICTGKTS